jgi:hypothetical protein
MIIIFYSKILIILFSFLFNLIIIKLYILKIKKYENNNIPSISNYLYNESIYFNLSYLQYYYSKKYKFIKIKYGIVFYDLNKTLILPSDLSLYKNLHVICLLNIINEKIEINSLPNIHLNKFYECIEFINLNEESKVGIKIYRAKENIKYYINFYFPLDIFNNNNKIIYGNDEIFESIILNKEYTNIIKSFYDKNKNNTLKLKKLYIEFPLCNLKRDVAINENVWYFQNIYSDYFCFCKGFFCLEGKNSQKCKYFFYLYIIDNNRNIYEKKDYLFIDFIFSEYSADDVYPIFRQMIEKKQPVHYLTEKMNIYQQYCFKKDKCLAIIYVNKNNYTMNGDFLENYLTIILKLKQVISGGGIYFNYINNLFYNIEYILYICVGHGVSFFKHFLYADYDVYGYKIYDKILLPPSKKLISIVKSYGWSEENIIKINLPRWDKYNNENSYILYDNSSITNNSILIMFTWRHFKKNKNISHFYFKNIFSLINNEKLNFYLKGSNISLFFSLHHKLKNFEIKIKKNKYIQYIEEIQISECLSKINLIITDFSSIIFDIIYRRKPFIIYIPDADDPEIENIYEKTYFDLIQSLKNGTIIFENKYFNLIEVVNKIIYYISNNFNLETKLEKFYDSFEFKKGNNTIEFINYISNLI